MFKLFGKVIWKRPAGSNYYPIFVKDFWYYYPGAGGKCEWETKEEALRAHKKYCPNKISKIRYFLDGFKN